MHLHRREGGGDAPGELRSLLGIQIQHDHIRPDLADPVEEPLGSVFSATIRPELDQDAEQPSYAITPKSPMSTRATLLLPGHLRPPKVEAEGASA
jgi:hypothetical protein